MSKCIALIHNPTAGRRRKGRVHNLAKLLEAQGHTVTTAPTLHPGHGTQLAASLAPSHDLLVACGGDGTLNDIINGLESHPKTPVALLPLGTANVVAHELGLPFSPKEVARLIQNAPPKPVDLMELDDGATARRGTMCVGLGFDGATTHMISLPLKRRFGKGAYVLAGIKALRATRHHTLDVEVDGKPFHAGHIIVSNICHYGGRFKLCPKARMDDGKLHAVLLPTGLWPLARCLLMLGFGKIDKAPGVQMMACQSVRLPASTLMQIDGDSTESGPAVVRLLPRALHILAPE